MTIRFSMQRVPFLVLLLAGCTAPDPPHPTDMTVVHHKFQIIPAAATITVNGQPGMQEFQAWMDAQDVTSRALWQLNDKAVGVISQGVFLTNYPPPPEGDYPVSATFRVVEGDLRAEAIVTIVVPH